MAGSSVVMLRAGSCPHAGCLTNLLPLHVEAVVADGAAELALEALDADVETKKHTQAASTQQADAYSSQSAASQLTAECHPPHRVAVSLRRALASSVDVDAQRQVFMPLQRRAVLQILPRRGQISQLLLRHRDARVLQDGQLHARADTAIATQASSEERPRQEAMPECAVRAQRERAMRCAACCVRARVTLSAPMVRQPAMLYD